jgi:hypothetical protein
MSALDRVKSLDIVKFILLTIGVTISRVVSSMGNVIVEIRVRLTELFSVY